MNGSQALHLAPVEPDSSEVCSEPANRLMLAVLEEALVTFQTGLDSPRPEARHRFFEVDSWIASQDTDSAFSFENICTSLRIDPEYIRKGLRRMKKLALGGAPGEIAGPGLRRERIYSRRGWKGQIG